MWYILRAAWRAIKVAFYGRATTRRRAFKLEIIAPYCVRSNGRTFINSSKSSYSAARHSEWLIRINHEERSDEKDIGKNNKNFNSN